MNDKLVQRNTGHDPWNIAIVGGGFIVPHLTLEACAAVRAAHVVFYSRATSRAIRAVRELNPCAELVNLDEGVYRIGDYRPRLYENMALRVVNVASRTLGDTSMRVVLLEPGSAIVTDSVTHAVLAESRRCHLRVKLIPGISCIELVLATLQYDPSDGIQVIQAQKLILGERKIDPRSALIVIQPFYYDTLWWIGSPYSTRTRGKCFSDKLSEAYPRFHPMTALRFPMDVRQGANVLWFRVSDLANVFPLLSPLHTIFVPPIKNPDRELEFQERIQSWEHLLQHVETDARGQIRQRREAETALGWCDLPTDLREQSRLLECEWATRHSRP